ncbi:HNH endonuclease [Bradyrhizobium quebecense]|uniref:HNH endonuclease 5 domain-containing protein n=1 Tax=Bradyrhizobium quebecense TaxID=2748629 RepID=A0A974AJM4_9BRAD|nr:hypothetical protein [Bradyrhizobium quebecense]UGA43754.1 HNH endonuclease [Bradyrhizobium quebecense]
MQSLALFVVLPPGTAWRQEIVMDEPPSTNDGMFVETEAFKALEFYVRNYTALTFVGLGSENRGIVLGSKPFVCRYCRGKPPEKTFKKTAHAVSQLLGNRILVSLYECDDCNKRFGGFEDDLGKMTLPMRAIGGVIGKNGIPKIPLASRSGMRKPTLEHKDGNLNFSHDAGDDVGLVDDPVNKTLTLTYNEQRYRPLAAYKALCKSAFALLPDDELMNFEELRQWLLQADVTTGMVYGRNSYILHKTFVPAHKPFKQPVVCLLRRNSQIDAPYISFFIAFGNVSYQIFLPCPSKDAHLTGKTITTLAYPHFFQLKPWLIPAPTVARTENLGSPDQTANRLGRLGWRYDQKIKVS